MGKLMKHVVKREGRVWAIVLVVMLAYIIGESQTQCWSWMTDAFWERYINVKPE